MNMIYTVLKYFLVPTITKYNCIKENNYLAFRNTYLLLFTVLVNPEQVTWYTLCPFAIIL